METADTPGENPAIGHRSEGGTLVAVLSNPVEFYCLPSRVGRTIQIGPREFNSLEGITYEPDLFAWLGFFDWLRPVPGDVVGVRLNRYVVRVPELFEPMPHSIRFFIEDGDVLLFFGDDMGFDESHACDQSISDSQLMIDSEGTYAVTFQADDLTNEEWTAMKRRILGKNLP